MRRFTAVFLIVILTLSFAGCSMVEQSKSNSKRSAQTIYERGLECMSLFDERREFLMDMMDHSDFDLGSLEDLLEDFYDCDLSDPSKIIRLSGDQDRMTKYLEEELDIDSDDFPDYLRDERMINIFYLGNLNSFNLTDQFSLSSMLVSYLLPHLNATTSFVYKGLEECESYLYLYKNSFPIQISFYPGEDNTVMARLNVVVAEDFPTSVKAIKEYYADHFGDEYTKILDLEKM